MHPRGAKCGEVGALEKCQKARGEGARKDCKKGGGLGTEDINRCVDRGRRAIGG